MTAKPLAGFLLLLTGAALMACESQPVKPESATPSLGFKKPGLVLTVSTVLSGKSQYLGMPVQVRGRDAGWQGGCSTPPPVSRSDWQLVDDSGACLYVHGPRPEPGSEATGKQRLSVINGHLREGRGGVLYLDATSTN